MLRLSKVRRTSYRVGRRLGDVQAVTHPRRIPRRIANKVIGRKAVSKLWR